jgi:hypothetical protein
MAGTSYIGKAGQLAAMAEFLLRGYNVAQPEVDVGDDIFVVHDRSGKMWRIQVKTAICKQRRYGWSGQVNVAEEQLKESKTPDLHYVFALRCGNQWEFVNFPRQTVNDEYKEHDAGTLNREKVIFTIRLHVTDVQCSGRSWQLFHNNWAEWPTL